MTAETFAGFPEEGLQFLADLAENNNRDWFNGHKQHYKRVPRGFAPDHPRVDLLRYNALYASSPGIEPAVLSSTGLVDAVMDHCEKMAWLRFNGGW